MATNEQKRAAREHREQAHEAADAHDRSNRRLVGLAAIVGAAVLVVALVVILGGGSGSSKPANGELAGTQETKTLLDGIPQDGLVLGDPDAPVQIIEFVDLQCPHCRDNQLDDAPTVINELVRTGKASLRLAPLAFLGEDSVAGRAALLRLSAEDRAFQFTNLWYWNQGVENSGYATEEYISRLATAAGGPASAAEPRTPEGEAATLAAETDALGQALMPSGPSTPTFAVGAAGEDPETYKVFEPGTTPEQLAEAVESAS